jgi:tetratricopeptide (TPR) repeat protein
MGLPYSPSDGDQNMASSRLWHKVKGWFSTPVKTSELAIPRTVLHETAGEAAPPAPPTPASGNGETLQDWIADGKCLDYRVGLDLAIQCCHHLERAHGQGLLHENLQPAHILMSGTGVARIASFEGAAGGRDGVRVGAPAYLAPEQGRDPRRRSEAVPEGVWTDSDVYSFGVCLWEMVCGRLPFTDWTAHTGQPPEPQDARQDLPASLRTLLLDVIALDRRQRPPDFAQLRERLNSVYRELFRQDAPSYRSALPDAGAAQEGQPWQPGQTVFGEYRVERELGRGGMGAVYLLTNTANGQCFAVKRALLASEVHRRLFLGELQTWLDLPEHPHIAPCRFFRSLGHELVIFAEFLDGGSLEDRLGRPALSHTEEILDAAIQYAWSLHALHELGQVHQDVKPANALLTAKGVLKVADFGLTRARKQGGLLPAADDAVRSVVATHAGGYTPAYCSPEQARDEPLTRRTDLWSWGLSVLAMFCGKCNWENGVVAAHVLADWEKRKARPAGAPPLPREVAEVLRRCFQPRPEDRWPSLLEAAEALARAYRKLTGQPYPRPRPAFPSAEERRQFEHNRQVGNVQWRDPRLWLEEALRADGRDPADAQAQAGPQGRSRAAQAVGDLALYDEAYRIFDRLVQSGRAELRERLASLCTDKALVHDYLNDPPGRLGMYERTTVIYQRLVEQEGRRELANDLAMALMNQAIAVQAMGQLPEAVALYKRSVAIRQRLVEQEGRRELANGLAMALMNQANAIQALGRLPEAVVLYERSVAIYQRLVEQEGRRELADDLAAALMNQANAVRALGRLPEAVALCARSIALYQRLVEQEGRRELANELAGALMNQAIAVSDMGQLPEAVGLFERAVAIYQRLVEQEGRRELANDLALALMNQANAIQALGRLPEAVALYERAIALYQRLVEQEGRRELANDLARALTNQAISLAVMGQLPEAVGLFERAVAIYQRLVEQEGRRELANDLALALMNQANAIQALGRLPEAVALYERAVAIFQRLVEQEGRRELANDLARALMNQAIAVSEMGQLPEAVALYERAVAIRQRLVEQEGRRELANDLATALTNQALAVSEMGQLPEAVALYERAVAIRQRLVEQEGRRELANDLARALMNQAIAVSEMGQLPEAVALYERAVAIRQRLVEQEGRRELANDLATALTNQALAVSEMGQLPEAVALYERAVAIRQRLVEQEGRRELTGDWARVVAYRAALLPQLGKSEQARADARWAIKTLEQEVARTGRADLRDVLKWAQQNLPH